MACLAHESSCVQAATRKKKLADSYDFQRFLVDYRDLMSWVNGINALVSSDELGKDVGSAEALLERHQVNTTPRLIFVHLSVGRSW